MPSLKIGLLSYRSDPFSGGQGIYLKNVAEALVQRNHEVTIYSAKPLPIVSSDVRIVEIDTPGYFETFDPLERLNIFRSRTKNQLEILDFLDTFTGTFTEPIFFGERLLKNKDFQDNLDTFDIIHDNQSMSSYPETVRKKLVTTLHHPIHIDRDIDLSSESSFFAKLSIKRWYSFLNMQKKNLSKAPCIISPSVSSKKDIQKFFNIPEEKIKVIWNGIDLNDCKHQIREGFQPKFVTIISSDVPMKNLKTIIKAVHLLRNEVPEISLTIIGDLREENKKLIEDLKLEKEIIYLGKVDRPELIKILNNSFIGISASSYEGFGFPSVEMISTGLPVIVSNKASLPELAGDAGLTFEPSSPTDLKEKMLSVVNNVNLREELQQNSKLRRDDFFGWDEYAKKLEVLYQELISGHF